MLRRWGFGCIFSPKPHKRGKELRIMLPEHAPFTPDQRKALESIIVSLDAVQKSWLSGFLAAGASVSAPAGVPAPAPSAKLTVVYGTESGNSETLADRTVKEAKKRGFQAVMKNMSEIQP